MVTAAQPIAFTYAKGSALLARYLEMNRVTAVQVWRECGRNRNRVALVSESGIGFPEEGRFSLAEAKTFARQLADHCGLPVIESI